MLSEAIIQTSTPTSLKIGGAAADEILILESISGLSNVKVNQFMGDYAREGSYYQGRRAEKRNAVFNFKLKPNWAQNIGADDLREMLYRMFMEPTRDSDAVQVLLKDTKRPDRYFIGYTETIESDIFVKDLKAQVSLNTVDAYLRSAAISQFTRELGWFRIPMVYEGSADTGMTIKLKVLVDTPYVTAQNGNDLMILQQNFYAGDIIELRTTAGDRAVLVNGVDRMSAMTPASKWITLRQQSNVLQAYGQLVTDQRVVITSYSYRAAWWGV